MKLLNHLKSLHDYDNFRVTKVKQLVRKYQTRNIFNCTKCNRGFTRKDKRNKHEGNCKNKFVIICPEQDCEKNFSKKDTLNEHLFTCTMCPRKFSG